MMRKFVVVLSKVRRNIGENFLVYIKSIYSGDKFE